MPWWWWERTATRSSSLDRGHAGARLELDLVVAEDAGRVHVAVGGLEVSVERAAKDDVEQLHTAADCQDGHLGLQRPREQCHLEGVADAVGGERVLVRLLAIERGIEVGAAGHDQAVEHRQHRLRLVAELVVGGQDHRQAAVGDDRP